MNNTTPDEITPAFELSEEDQAAQEAQVFRRSAAGKAKAEAPASIVGIRIPDNPDQVIRIG